MQEILSAGKKSPKIEPVKQEPTQVQVNLQSAATTVIQQQQQSVSAQPLQQQYALHNGQYYANQVQPGQFYPNQIQQIPQLTGFPPVIAQSQYGFPPPSKLIFSFINEQSGYYLMAVN